MLGPLPSLSPGRVSGGTRWRGRRRARSRRARPTGTEIERRRGVPPPAPSAGLDVERARQAGAPGRAVAPEDPSERAASGRDRTRSRLPPGGRRGTRRGAPPGQAASSTERARGAVGGEPAGRACTSLRRSGCRIARWRPLTGAPPAGCHRSRGVPVARPAASAAAATRRSSARRGAGSRGARQERSARRCARCPAGRPAPPRSLVDLGEQERGPLPLRDPASARSSSPERRVSIASRSADGAAAARLARPRNERTIFRRRNSSSATWLAIW